MTDAPPPSALRASKGRLLVVDDNRLVLATLAGGLTGAGFEVFDADNGDDAILLAREHRPDLALLDIRMQGKSGFDVAEYLRAQHRIPFMFLSAFADAETAAQVKALGAVAYLVKPLDIKQIVPVVEAALADAGPAPAREPLATAVPVRGDAVRPDARVSMAAGVLMLRHTLTRDAALARLHQLAASEGRSPVEHAEALLAAIERLAAT